MPPAEKGHRRLDLAIGIVAGIVLGLAVIIVFVFLGSEGTVDAPRISGVDTGKPALESKGAPANQLPGEPALGVKGSGSSGGSGPSGSTGSSEEQP